MPKRKVKQQDPAANLKPLRGALWVYVRAANEHSFDTWKKYDYPAWTLRAVVDRPADSEEYGYLYYGSHQPTCNPLSVTVGLTPEMVHLEAGWILGGLWRGVAVMLEGLESHTPRKGNEILLWDRSATLANAQRLLTFDEGDTPVTLPAASGRDDAYGD